MLASVNPTAAFAAEDAAPTRTQPEPRRDARGITGISPLAEALARGDRAWQAGDFATAASAYEAAIREHGDNTAGYVRLASVLGKQGNLQGALDVWRSALALAVAPVERGRILMARATLLERMKDLTGAEADWRAYLNLAMANEPARPQGIQVSAESAVRLFPAAAEERLRQIAASRARQPAADAVRQRIVTRQQQPDPH